uniref:Hydroxysteroid 17-beta dehydrogenase 2 n=1 Tax=Naja naja TaxID=35670 RepID=A0A8C6YH18_NAJNA
MIVAVFPFKLQSCVLLLLDWLMELMYADWMAFPETLCGTDSGIGHELAKYLDSLGFTIFAGVLSATGHGAKSLKETCSERLSILQLDITSSAQIKEAYLEIRRKLQQEGMLWAVINNAGILGFIADGELLPMSSYKQCMDVNFFGPVEISKMFLPLLRQSKGRIINISSLAGGIPMPRFAAYGASKAALSMFSGVMRQELSKWGIKVAVLHPSGFKTSIGGNPEDWKKEEQVILGSLAPDVKKDYGEDYIHNLKMFLGEMSSISSSDLSPVFSDVLHALLAEQPKGLYTPGKNSYLFLLSSLFQRFISIFFPDLLFGLIQSVYIYIFPPMILLRSI